MTLGLKAMNPMPNCAHIPHIGQMQMVEYISACLGVGAEAARRHPV